MTPRLTPATVLTVGRMVLALPIAWSITANAQWVAVGLLLLATATDFLDGYLARARNEVTALGATLDPIADKLIAVAVLLSLAAVGTLEGVHLLAALAILLRETLVSGLRESASALGGLPVTALAKVKTTAQFVAFILLCAGPSTIGLGLLWVAAALTLYTGAQYLIRWWASQS